MVCTLDRETHLGIGVWLSPGPLVLRDKNETLKIGTDMGEPMEEEQYLFQLQIDWDHCRVCRLRLLAGTGPAGSLVAEGRKKRTKKKEWKTASYILGGMDHRSQEVPRLDGEIKAMGWLLFEMG